MFWEIVYIKCGLYCISDFIYLLLVIFHRDVTRVRVQVMRLGWFTTGEESIGKDYE